VFFTFQIFEFISLHVFRYFALCFLLFINTSSLSCSLTHQFMFFTAFKYFSFLHLPLSNYCSLYSFVLPYISIYVICFQLFPFIFSSVSECLIYRVLCFHCLQILQFVYPCLKMCYSQSSFKVRVRVS